MSDKGTLTDVTADPGAAPTEGWNANVVKLLIRRSDPSKNRVATKGGAHDRMCSVAQTPRWQPPRWRNCKRCFQILRRGGAWKLRGKFTGTSVTGLRSPCTSSP